MEEKKEFKLFREKSLEAIESPESLNDYLRVTSPGVWLVLAAVVALLVGAVLWGVFGRINTTGRFAVSSNAGSCVCYVGYDSVDSVMARGVVTVNGEDYPLITDVECDTEVVSEGTNPYIRVAGGLTIGDLTVKIPVAAELPTGVYTGTVITESLKPISLLLQ